jgi:hypothetical protein
MVLVRVRLKDYADGDRKFIKVLAALLDETLLNKNK